MKPPEEYLVSLRARLATLREEVEADPERPTPVDWARRDVLLHSIERWEGELDPNP